MRDIGTWSVAVIGHRRFKIKAFDIREVCVVSGRDQVRRLVPRVKRTSFFIIPAGSSDENLYAVDADTGTQQWAFETSSSVYSSPAISDEIVYFGSLDAYLYAVGANTGAQQWALDLEGGVFSSPTVVEQHLYIGADDIYSIDIKFMSS
jgi:hypothetical protein